MANTKKPGVIGVHDHIEGTCRLARPDDFYTSGWGLTFIYPDDAAAEGTGYRAIPAITCPGPYGMFEFFQDDAPPNQCKADESTKIDEEEEGIENLTVPKGQLTFDAEGNDDPDSIYFSRRPHVPTPSSGLTIGRGYDMRTKTDEKIKSDLMKAGVLEELAEKFAKAAGKKGDAAETFIENNDLKIVVITRLQQKKLFEISYAELEQDTKRIATKADVTEKYGKTDWVKLKAKIKDVLVDLRFRGDYTPTARTHIQKHVAANDLEEFKKVICDKSIWPNVPQDRFNRRCKYLT